MKHTIRKAWRWLLSDVMGADTRQDAGVYTPAEERALYAVRPITCDLCQREAADTETVRFDRDNQTARHERCHAVNTPMA